MVLVLAEAALWFVAGDVDGGWAREEGLTQTSFAQQYMRSVEWAVSRWDTVGRSKAEAPIILNILIDPASCAGSLLHH